MNTFLTGVELPPITVRIDEPSLNKALRSVFVWGLVLGASLMVISVVLKKATA